MPKIKDLSAAELARHANNVFIFSGRHQIGARLVYRALELDPYQPVGLRDLSDLLDYGGTEALSGLVLEYALAPDSPIDDASRKTLDDLRFLAMWGWSFIRHKSGATALEGEAFEHRDQFVVDNEGYQAFLEPVLEQAGSLDGAFRAAHTLIGAMGDLLQHKSADTKMGIEEAFHPDRFEPTPTYAEWLQSDTSDLDTLEQQRRGLTARG